LNITDKNGAIVQTPVDTCGDPACCPPQESIGTFTRNAPKVGRNSLSLRQRTLIQEVLRRQHLTDIRQRSGIAFPAYRIPSQ